MMQMETQALRQQLQEDWEAGEAERQELLRQLHAQAATAAAKVNIYILQCSTQLMSAFMQRASHVITANESWQKPPVGYQACTVEPGRATTGSMGPQDAAQQRRLAAQCILTYHPQQQHTRLLVTVLGLSVDICLPLC